MSKVVVLLAVTGGALLMAALTPVAGLLADRYGRRRVFGIGVVGFGVTVVPSFFAVHSGIPWLVVAVLLLQLGVWYALMTGAESTLFAELFDTAVALMPRWIGGRPFWAAGTRW